MCKHRCQERMEETGRLNDAYGITILSSFGGYTRVEITCIHGDSWTQLLMPGDPMLRSLGNMLFEVYAAA